MWIKKIIALINFAAIDLFSRPAFILLIQPQRINLFQRIMHITLRPYPPTALSGPAINTVRSLHHSNDAGCSKTPFLHRTTVPDSAVHSTLLRLPHPPDNAGRLSSRWSGGELLLRCRLICSE
nr:hypothetical protein PB20LOC_04321 [Pectobacterium parmentieri]